jgi:hypothetical protein
MWLLPELEYGPCVYQKFISPMIRLATCGQDIHGCWRSKTASEMISRFQEFFLPEGRTADAGFLDLGKSTLRDTVSWEWTNKSSASFATGTTQSASVTIGGPAFGYAGKTVLALYPDTIYHTFAFVIEPVIAKEISQ